MAMTGEMGPWMVLDLFLRSRRIDMHDAVSGF